jgi:multicomponent Na+:H+ antiporter subunit B
MGARPAGEAGFQFGLAHAGEEIVHIEFAGRDIGVPNLVTAILASYRGYDTWGETAVIFTACVGVMLLLGGARTVHRWRRREDADRDGRGR